MNFSIIINSFKRKQTFIFLSAASCLFLMVTPVYFSMIFFALITNVIEDDDILNGVALIQLVLYVSLISSIDIHGDLSNYSYLYYHIAEQAIREEYFAEPLILLSFDFLSMFGLTFRTVIYLISFFYASMMLLIIKSALRGRVGTKAFIVFCIFPMEIQSPLYILRQSISSVFIFLYILSNRIQSIISLMFSIGAHSSAILVFFLERLSKFVGHFIIRKNVLVCVIAFLIAFPISTSMISTWLQSIVDISLIQRKVGFYQNQNFDEIEQSISIFSTGFIFMHFTCLTFLVSRFSNENKIHYSLVFIFIIQYLLALLFRDYLNLPMRLSFFGFVFSPVIYYILRDYLCVYYKKYFDFVFFILILISFSRFIMLNDNGYLDIFFFNYKISEYTLLNYIGGFGE